MNSFSIASLLLCWCLLQTANALCGEGILKDSVGIHDYNRFGSNNSEKCDWTFDIPIEEDSMLILNIREFTTYRSGTMNNAFLTLPDGRKLHFHNKKHFVGKCLRFSKKNFKTNKCLETLTDRYCLGDTTESEQWPPKLSSVSLTSLSVGSGKFSYDIEFQYFYMVVSCANLENSETNNFVGIIGLGAALIVILLIAALIIFVLIKKTKKTKGSVQRGVDNLPPPYVAPLPSRHTTDSTSVPPNYSSIQESYETPHYLQVDPPTTTRNLHDYCQVEERPTGASSSFTVVSNNGVVNNALYSL